MPIWSLHREKSSWPNGPLWKSTKISKTKEPLWGKVARCFGTGSAAGSILVQDSRSCKGRLSQALGFQNEKPTVWVGTMVVCHGPIVLTILRCFQFGAIKIKLLKTFTSWFLCGSKFSRLWAKCPAVWFLGRLVVTREVSKKLPKCLPQRLYRLTFSSTMSGWSGSSVFAQASCVITVFYCSHSDRGRVTSPCGFAWHFPHG